MSFVTTLQEEVNMEEPTPESEPEPEPVNPESEESEVGERMNFLVQLTLKYLNWDSLWSNLVHCIFSKLEVQLN